MSTADLIASLQGAKAHADPHEQRRILRQALVALGTSLDGVGANALDGCDPGPLESGVAAGLDRAVFDDLDWLGGPAAAAALYELSTVLPLGTVRIELSRRVLALLYESDAATFTAMATRMAMGSARGLAGAGIQARVALALALPLSVDLPIDRLAHAIARRPDLSARWVVANATGSLPSRRLAGRTLERAARYAARAEESGHPLDAEELQQAFDSLLADRENLVWRHAASARGVLAALDPKLASAIEHELSPHFGPTEWRRGAASLVASIGVRPHEAKARTIALLDSDLVARDPGIAGAMAFGLPAAADFEPEAAREIAERLASMAPLAAAEPLIDAWYEIPGFGEPQLRQIEETLRLSRDAVDAESSLTAFAEALGEDLASIGRGPEQDASLRGQIRRAHAAYETRGPAAAHEMAVEALRQATARLGELTERDAIPKATVRALRELDSSLLESGVLDHLLLLARRGAAENAEVAELDALRGGLTDWLLAREGTTATFAEVEAAGHLRRLKALLHVVDADTGDSDDDARRASIRRRWTETAHNLFDRLRRGDAPPLRRALAATVARALDALVRQNAAEPVDVLLTTAHHLEDGQAIAILGEASRHPETKELLAAYAGFVGSARDALSTPHALSQLALALSGGWSARLQRVQQSLSNIAIALGTVAGATALSSLLPTRSSERSPLSLFEEEAEVLMRLAAGALSRCTGHTPAPARGELRVADAVAALVRKPDDSSAGLVDAVDAARVRLSKSLPPHLATPIGELLNALVGLPVAEEAAPNSTLTPENTLPSWLPPRRTIGGFSVVRALGSGGASTVFIAKRSEERHDPSAESFALKAPDYDAAAARALTEREFLRIFREEAAALLSLPEHDNLARFVTFDAGARPKPILVMEFIEGQNLEEKLQAGQLSLPSLTTQLGGILRGLGAMHARGIGHLDVKPSNVILRADGTPVLVDFGLSGRRIRPGCGTGAYAAPEVWGLDDTDEADPCAADVYSFACMTFELLTGVPLFDQVDDMALIAAHLAHDGDPAALGALEPAHPALVRLLRQCLRRAPANRPSSERLQADLAEVLTPLVGAEWPLEVAGP